MDRLRGFNCEGGWNRGMKRKDKEIESLQKWQKAFRMFWEWRTETCERDEQEDRPLGLKEHRGNRTGTREEIGEIKNIWEG